MRDTECPSCRTGELLLIEMGYQRSSFDLFTAEDGFIQPFASEFEADDHGYTQIRCNDCDAEWSSIAELRNAYLRTFGYSETAHG